MSINEATNHLEKLLQQEINKIPRPFGIFLSGGIDSGILAALSKPDFAVTCNFQEGKEYDELEYASKIANYLKIRLDVIQPQRENFESDLKSALKIIGQPINSVSVVPWYNLMEYAQGKTMVNGEGADELFGGYSRYLILKQVFDLYKLPSLENYHPTLDFLFRSIHSRLVEKEMPFTIDMNELMKNEYELGLPEILLMEHKLAEHFKVKFYQPFMSPRIKEFAQGLPIEYKIKNYTTKFILRELAKEYLPGVVVRRREKKGLVCPVNKWMGWTGERGKYDKVKYVEYQNEIISHFDRI